MNEALIPQDLRARPQWVCWKLEERGGKTTKVPYSPNGQHAKSSDPATWTTFEEACKASRDYAGVGYVFSPDDPFVGIDLDDCLDTDGTVRPWAMPILVSFADTYMEVSPSGTGVKVFTKGTLKGSCKGPIEDGAVEIYDRGRFFTVTGQRWNDAPIAITEQQAAIGAAVELITGRATEAKAAFSTAGRIASGDTFGIDPFKYGAAADGILGAAANVDDFLVAVAGKMRYFGHSEASIRAHIGLLNTTMCSLDRSDEDLDRIARSMASKEPGPQETLEAEAWEEPLPIESALKPVAPLDLECVPRLLADYCAKIATNLDVPVEYPLIATITGMSIAIGNRATIQPKALDTSWQQVPNLWGVIIGGPGTTKTAAMYSAIAPLLKIDAEQKQENEPAQQTYRKKLREYALREAIYKTECKKVLKADINAELPDPPQAPEKPVYRQIILNDCSVEKLHEICVGNPCGVLAFHDELAGWFASMEKDGHESERPIWLKGWYGNQSHSISTLSRGDVYVPKLCLSVLGSTQPGKWRGYIQTIFGRHATGNDGLLQRLQLCVWPDATARGYNDTAWDDSVSEQIEARFRSMVELGANIEAPSVYRFTPDAQKIFVDWWARLVDRLRKSEKSEAIESHFAKYKGLLPSLALIFQLIDDPSAMAVDAVNTERAVRFCRWLSQHVERTYGCLEMASDGAAILAGHIKDGDLGASFTYREVRRKGWRDLRGPEDVRRALGVLTEAAWIRFEPKKQRYEVNPGCARMDI
jgi:hypothetical protein